MYSIPHILFIKWNTFSASNIQKSDWNKRRYFRYRDWSCIAMSLTLHTTEIWVKTGTDSGGMKDRTHGIFSGSASNTGHKQTPRGAASLPRSEVHVMTGSLRFSPQQACSRSVLGFETEADPGTWCRAGGWDAWFMRKPPRLRGWQRAQQELDAGLSLFLNRSLSLSETRPAPRRGSRVSALWHVITGLSCRTF